jgi:hypothetical protein
MPFDAAIITPLRLSLSLLPFIFADFAFIIFDARWLRACFAAPCHFRCHCRCVLPARALLRAIDAFAGLLALSLDISFFILFSPLFHAIIFIDY